MFPLSILRPTSPAQRGERNESVRDSREAAGAQGVLLRFIFPFTPFSRNSSYEFFMK